MDIIIVGGGKVGSSLAQILCDEHNITVIDLDENRIQTIINESEVKGIVGNCLQTAVLDEADVDKCNIFIALTDSDEVNILSCLIAKKMNARHCIARVRNPEFDKQLVFMREELGISMMINPDFIAANEIAKVIRYPDAINIETFAKGKVDLTEIRITKGSILENIALSQLTKRLGLDILICAVISALIYSIFARVMTEGSLKSAGSISSTLHMSSNFCCVNSPSRFVSHAAGALVNISEKYILTSTIETVSAICSIFDTGRSKYSFA